VAVELRHGAHVEHDPLVVSHRLASTLVAVPWAGTADRSSGQEAAHLELTGVQPAADLAARPVQPDEPGVVGGQAVDGEGGAHAVGELQVGELVVGHVVVSVVDAASIRAGLERPQAALRGRIVGHHRDRPAGHLRGALDVEADRVEGAGGGGRAPAFPLDASVERAGRRLLRPKVVEAADARDRGASVARQPAQQVKVMACLGQDHRAGLVLPPPAATHEAVGEMPVADAFRVLDRHQLPDPAVVERALHGAEERRVAQHMSDRHAARTVRRGGRDGSHLLEGRRDRLLEHDIDTKLERGNGWRRVLPVRRGDHDRIRFGRRRQQLLPCPVRGRGIQVVLGRHSMAPRRNRIGHGHDLRPLRMLATPAAVGAASTVAGTDDRQSNRAWAVAQASLSPAPRRRRVETSTERSAPSWAGCSTNATRRLAMKRPVRTGVPERVTSLTSTTPRAVVISTRRPARVAAISNVCVPPWPVSTTASTRSPFN
jgi:hypothetical protein